MTDKMKFETPNLTAENVAKIAELFPGVVTEGKVNIDLLRSMLGEEVYGDEAYEFTWVGKRAAIAEADVPGVIGMTRHGRRTPIDVLLRIGEEIRINGRTRIANAVIHQPLQLNCRRQPPVVIATQTRGIHRGDIAFRITVDATAAAATILRASITAIGGGIWVIPAVAIVFIPQAAVIGMNFPQQAGDIVFHAAPLGGRGG